MKVTFYGAAQEVGRSCIMISTEKTRVLLDAGIRPEDNEPPKIEDSVLKNVDAILVSHAHMDHSAYLPHIYSKGFKGYVYMTKPTMELLNILIPDYMHLANPKDVTKEGLASLNKHFKITDYKKEFVIGDLKCEFIPAGHIVGSALIRVTDGKQTVIYTGDINLTQTRLLNGADLKDIKADVLITESTYGGKDDIKANEKEQSPLFLKSIKDTLLQGGKIIIPSFAVGRAQEVLLFLDDYLNSGIIPKVPIYVDGMINKTMRIHRHNVIFCRKELQMRILMSDYDPFRSPNFTPIESRQQREKTGKIDQSCIVVTTSGMITGGPVLYYLTKWGGNPANKLILIGYQPRGTRGRQLQDGERELNIDRKKVKIALKVETFHMSAHADRKQLEMIPKKIKGLKHIFLVHGEPDKMEDLKSYLSAKYRVTIPKLGESYSI
jgi:predicted metal-dependent RNase